MMLNAGFDNIKRKTVILIAREPAFFEREDTWFNRRGVDVFCASDIPELMLIAKVRCPDLIVSAGIPDSLREHQFRMIVPESVPLVILARIHDPKDELLEYSVGFHSTVIRRPYDDQVMRATAAALSGPTRKYLRLLIQLKFKDRSKAGAFGFSQNVSSSGILFETKRDIDVGTRIEMSFMLPGQHQMTRVEGEVVRHAPSIKLDSHCYGVQFLDLCAEHKAYLDCLNQRAPSTTAKSAPIRTATALYGG